MTDDRSIDDTNIDDPNFEASRAPECLVRGKAAFEAGFYQDAIALLRQGEMAQTDDRSMAVDGELKIWLVMAYEAAGDRSAALNLCRIVSRHPHGQTRDQGKRLLYILEAPKLKMKSEWLVEIPDLSHLENTNDRAWTPPPINLSPPPKLRPTTPKGYVIPEPTDPTTVNMGDERSVFWLLGAVGAVLVGLGFYATM